MGHTATLIAVGVATVLWGIAFLLSLLMAGLSPMLFDAPGSENNGWQWVGLCILLALPALFLISIVGALRALSGGNDATALWFCAAPLLLIVPLIIISGKMF